MIKTAEGKWVLWNLETRQQSEFWPIDATRLIEIGSHSTDAPEGASVTVPPSLPRNVGIPKAATVKHAEADELKTRSTTKKE